jgi:GDP-L-fucose synthase
VTSPISQKRITITGGAGFLGSHLVPRLRSRGCSQIIVPRKKDYDLTEREGARRLYQDTQPEVVFHLAATVGGIGANRDNPGRFFYENMAMGLHLIDEARSYGRLEKLVLVGTTCSYPKYTPTPFREEDFWNGYPEETNAPYGIAKKALLVMAQGYREQYGLQSIYLVPANLYGPGDNFDLESCHVIPALIRKFVDAKASGGSSVTVWGTGRASREFLFVEDAAEALALAAEHYQGSHPVNLGAGTEIRIRDLVFEIMDLVGYQGEVIWDTSMPDGQPRRCLDVSRAENYFGFRARTPLHVGLQKTIAWYLEHRGSQKATGLAEAGIPGQP